MQILGIDFPRVRFVIHMAGSHSLLDFAQESGRAGRDGAKGTSVVVTSPIRNHKDLHDEDNTFTKWMQNKNECRRLLLYQYLDGRGENCLSSNKNMLCDNCRRDIQQTQGIYYFKARCNSLY